MLLLLKRFWGVDGTKPLTKEPQKTDVEEPSTDSLGIPAIFSAVVSIKDITQPIVAPTRWKSHAGLVYMEGERAGGKAIT